MRIAILDLGTNTFNLLIAEVLGKDSWKPVLKVKEAVKLGQGGIHKGFIADEAYQRGMAAMERHYHRIRQFNTNRVLPLAPPPCAMQPMEKLSVKM
ncbi:MAG: hypothetical protein HC830_10495 [Bacteroidetes bacterium]|nr:hypothetical protein [Bacteroidota bacterium]